MVRPDPLQAAAASYAAERWDDDDWRRFGRETGTADLLSAHPRLYRSLGFGDPDYPDAAIEVLGQVLSEAIEQGSGEKGRMELLADSMPDLPSWIDANAPARTKRLFHEYRASRDFSEIPEQWLERHNVFDDYADKAASLDVEFPTPTSAEFEHVVAASVVVAGEPARPNLGSRKQEPESSIKAQSPKRPIFIVHGHDEAALNSIRIYVFTHTGVMPKSLAEEASRGDTIIEKFERVGGEAAYVIVLLTPDDVGQTIRDHEADIAPHPRARQNVVLELGYFIGKIGRKNIVVVDAAVERPSDLAGLSYVQYPGLNWKDDLRVELDAAELIS